MVVRSQGLGLKNEDLKMAKLVSTQKRKKEKREPFMVFRKFNRSSHGFWSQENRCDKQFRLIRSNRAVQFGF